MIKFRLIKKKVMNHFFFRSGGKQRSKMEVQKNSQHHDTSGDTRRIVQVMSNNEKNQKNEKK